MLNTNTCYTVVWTHCRPKWTLFRLYDTRLYDQTVCANVIKINQHVFFSMDRHEEYWNARGGDCMLAIITKKGKPLNAIWFPLVYLTTCSKLFVDLCVVYIVSPAITPVLELHGHYGFGNNFNGFPNLQIVWHDLAVVFIETNEIIVHCSGLILNDNSDLLCRKQKSKSPFIAHLNSVWIRNSSSTL